MSWTCCERVTIKCTGFSPSWKQVSLHDKAMALISLRVVVSCCDFCLKKCQVFQFINRSEDHVLVCLYVYLIFLAESP